MYQGENAPNLSPRLTRWARCLALLFFVGTSIALATWACTHPEELGPYLLRNQILPEARRGLLMLMILAGVGFVVAGVGLAVWDKLEACERAAKRMAPLLVSGPLPFLLNYQHWQGRDITFLCLTLACAVGAGVLIRPALEEGLYKPFSVPFQRLRSRPSLPLIAVVLVAISYALYFSISTINNHNNFGTSAFDLGIETNLVWNTAHFGPLFRSAPLGGNMLHGGFHQTYFAFLIAPFFAIFPRAETLLIIQSCFLGAAAIPLYLLAREKIGATKSAILCCFFALYAPMHGANLYDFHYQPFGVFFVLLVAYLFESGRSWKVLLPLVLVTLSIREDMGAMLGALGGFMLLSGKRPRDALILAALGSIYFVAMKLYVMPELFMNGRSSFAFMYKLLLPEGDEGFGGVLKTAVGNPVYTFDTMLVKEKLIYVLQIFVPLALLPLRRSVSLVLFLPGLVFTLLSTEYPALVMTSFQYTSYWTPMVFLSAVYALQATGPGAGMRRGLQTASLVSICLALLVTSTKYGSIFQVENSRGAYDPVHLRTTPEGKKNLADFNALAAKVPATAKVAASEWLISHVAARRDAYSLRNGVLDAEYILFWLHPTKFRHDERPVLMDALYKNRRYGVVERRGMFVLAKLGYELDRELPRTLRHEISTAGTSRAGQPMPKPSRKSTRGRSKGKRSTK